MAGYARYTALLDACVLLPLAVCDSLISVTATGLYAPKWTRRIEDEWTRPLEQKSGRPPGAYSVRRDATPRRNGKCPSKPEAASRGALSFLTQTACMFSPQPSLATPTASPRPT